MSYADIINVVGRLDKKYGEKDPVALCSLLGIKLNMFPMGTARDAVKGFFLIDRRVKVVTVNSDLPRVIQRIITAHEIGHARLHAGSGIRAFHEAGLFDESSLLEREANLFAAEYLLPDDEVLETLSGDNTFFTAAASLNVPPELLDFKFRLMKWKGYKLVEPPLTASSKFLKDMALPRYDEMN